ncbi:unnamed protein product [Leptosia nina]|uniref:Uncharacterized protein n=1 Tax=Leptosia nina TaxID=320188 RepID=A0AAV1JCQ0_9NEOP
MSKWLECRLRVLCKVTTQRDESGNNRAAARFLRSSKSKSSSLHGRAEGRKTQHYTQVHRRRGVLSLRDFTGSCLSERRIVWCQSATYRHGASGVEKAARETRVGGERGTRSDLTPSVGASAPHVALRPTT